MSHARADNRRAKDRKYTSLRLIYNVFLHPLRNYPGPLLWKATRLRWVIALQKGYLHRDLLDLHNQYGPVVRIAPDELSYIDPQAWKDIYTTRPSHATIERGAVWFQKATPDEPFSIMGHDEDHHARYRRAFMGAFSDKAIKDQSPRIEEYVELMMQKFRGKGENGSTVLDMVAWLNFVTFDISGDLSFVSHATFTGLDPKKVSRKRRGPIVRSLTGLYAGIGTVVRQYIAWSSSPLGRDSRAVWQRHCSYCFRQLLCAIAEVIEVRSACQGAGEGESGSVLSIVETQEYVLIVSRWYITDS